MINLESSGVEALDWRPRNDEHYHEAWFFAAGVRDAVDLFANWFDPIETEARARTFIEELIRGELDDVLARRVTGEARWPAVKKEWALPATGAAAGRDRRPAGFGPIEIAVPRVRLTTSAGKTAEWKGQAPLGCQRRTLAADALIASMYLAGTNTCQVRWGRALDFRCGNGSPSAVLKSKGFSPVGVDISTGGVAVARQAFPDIVFSNDLSAENIACLGPYDLALCIEVIAHCFDTGAEIKKIFDGLKPGGLLVLATPYYGHLNILVLALPGKLTEHHSVTPKANDVSMFTPELNSELLGDAGFTDADIGRVGRISARRRGHDRGGRQAMMARWMTAAIRCILPAWTVAAGSCGTGAVRGASLCRRT